MLRGLLLGLGIGIVAGWLLFGLDAAPARESSGRASSSRMPEASAANPNAAGDAATPMDAPAEAARDPLPPDAPTGLSITRDEDGSRRYLYAGRVIEARPLEVIDASAAQARMEKNWPEFLACILEYAVHDSPEADRRLVAIMGDEGLRLEGPWIGERFKEALLDSGIDGIAAAARARARVEMEENSGSRWAGRGFLSLLARYGSESDLDWLDTLRTDRNRSREVDRALAEGAANEVAAERLARSILESPSNAMIEPWREFAKANPDAAFGCASRLIREGYHYDNSFELLGAATTASNLARAQAVLSELDSDRARLRALRVADEARRNELDTSAFRDLIGLPHRILVRTGESRAEQKLAAAAIVAIRNHEVAWTQANLDALRAVAAGPSEDLVKCAADALEIIERKQEDASGWEPERDR